MSTIKQIDLGGITVTALDGGRFRLDGAALYGVLPRVFWEQKNRPDEDNRVLLSLSPLLVETGSEKILIDPGIGAGWGERAADRYAMDGQRPLVDLLADAGCDPAAITTVIATHLHFDHVAASVRFRGEPQEAPGTGLREWSELISHDLEPALPQAGFFVQADEIDAARRPDLRTAAYLAPTVIDVYRRAGQLGLLEGDTELFPGVRLQRTGGHTPGHQVVWLEGSEGSMLAAGDIVPTTTHLSGAVQEGLDHEPAVTAAVKAALLSRAAERGSYVSFFHAPRVLWGRVRPGPAGGYRLEETRTTKG